MIAYGVAYCEIARGGFLGEFVHGVLVGETVPLGFASKCSHRDFVRILPLWALLVELPMGACSVGIPSGPVSD